MCLHCEQRVPFVRVVLLQEETPEGHYDQVQGRQGVAVGSQQLGAHSLVQLALCPTVSIFPTPSRAALATHWPTTALAPGQHSGLVLHRNT